MGRTLGIDHGTQAIRFCLLEDQKLSFFKIKRERTQEASFLDRLEKKGFLNVDLIK
jgi:hypothetical protein